MSRKEFVVNNETGFFLFLRNWEFHSVTYAQSKSTVGLSFTPYLMWNDATQTRKREVSWKQAANVAFFEKKKNQISSCSGRHVYEEISAWLETDSYDSEAAEIGCSRRSKSKVQTTGWSCDMVLTDWTAVLCSNTSRVSLFQPIIHACVPTFDSSSTSAGYSSSFCILVDVEGRHATTVMYCLTPHALNTGGRVALDSAVLLYWSERPGVCAVTTATGVQKSTEGMGVFDSCRLQISKIFLHNDKTPLMMGGNVVGRFHDFLQLHLWVSDSVEFCGRRPWRLRALNT